MAVRSPQDIYARHVSSSRGYPLWTPEPSSQFLSCRPEGLRIGDVGVVVPENGNFDVFFNLCLHKDHPFHQANGVPDGFNPVELSDADVKTLQDVVNAGQVLTASSVTRLGSDRAIVGGEVLPRIGQSGTASYTFKLSSSEGALLVLPEGAESHDVRDTRPFFEQALRHAPTWYRFAEEKLGRIISHDAVYVITGFHKAHSWGLAGYENEGGHDDLTARFTIGAAREGAHSAAESYGWESSRNMDWRVGPLDGLGIPNQSVFIRGFKLALKSSVQGVPQRWISYQQPSGQSNRETSSGDSWLASAWRGISKTMGMSSEGTDRDTSVRVEIQRIPEILPVFHPSDVINQYILQKEPSAKVAITHDSDWGAILDQGLLKLEELVQEERLIEAVYQRYTIVLREGVAYLQIKSGLDRLDTIADNLPTTEAACQALINGVSGTAQPDHSKSLSVVSESNYRCIDESIPGSITSGSPPAELQSSIPSKFGVASGDIVSASPESLRPIKILVISDFVCTFSYICEKILHDAIEACRDLPIRFEVELRPFILVSVPSSPAAPIYRSAYVAKKLGKEQAEVKLKAAFEFGQKAGLQLAEDSILCNTTQAHRLCTKAYCDGGQDLQNKFATFLYEACLAKGADLSDPDVLVDAAASVGLMSKEDAATFLQSTEHLDCVEKMVQAARAHGINGVPFVIIDGKWAVNGLQPVECFIQIFRKLVHLPASSSVH